MRVLTAPDFTWDVKRDMQSSSNIKVIVVFVAALVGLACFGGVSAQEADRDVGHASSDTTFNEIHLSDDGVIAVDTAGYGWFYDFELETFVSGIPESESPDDPVERDYVGETVDLPVHERCVEEKQVSPFERRSITVGYDEYVDGDIITLGRVTIKGWVRGDVKSYNKRVLVTESGLVEGDVEAPEVVIRQGGLVRGEVIEGTAPLEFSDFSAPFSANFLIVVVSFTAILVFLTFLVVSLMPQQVGSFYRCFANNKIKTMLLGWLFLFLMPVIMGLVVITIVGVMVVVFVPLLYALACLLGIISFGNMIGVAFSIRFTGRERSFMFQSLAGVMVIACLWLVTAVLTGAGGSISEGLGVFFLVVSIVVTSFPVTAGIGVAILTRFGFREYVSASERIQLKAEPPAPAPAPPPIPSDTSPALPSPPDDPSPGRPPGP